jgi:hypothetical protein
MLKVVVNNDCLSGNSDFRHNIVSYCRRPCSSNKMSSVIWLACVVSKRERDAAAECKRRRGRRGYGGRGRRDGRGREVEDKSGVAKGAALGGRRRLKRMQVTHTWICSE